MSAATRMPTCFIPHGAGPCFFMDWNPPTTWHRMRDFLMGMADTLPARPTAIVMVSGHWLTGGFNVTSGAQPDLIYDYGGFPPHTYELRYPAPGEPQLAERITALLHAAGQPSQADPQRGFDHGMFIPLKLMFPDADVPVVQLSLRHDLDPLAHLQAGQALTPLRDEGVLIIGSGSMTHNLRAIFTTHAPVDAVLRPEAVAFTDWMADRMEAGALDDIVHAVERAPYGHDSHPTPDHFMPLPVALGAGMDDTGTFPKATRLHHSFTHGALAMDVYAFR